MRASALVVAEMLIGLVAVAVVRTVVAGLAMVPVKSASVAVQETDQPIVVVEWSHVGSGSYFRAPALVLTSMKVAVIVVEFAYHLSAP